MDLINKTAIVCGSTQGIGRSTAQKLAQMGASIILVSRNEEKLSRVLTDLPIVDKAQKHEILIADFTKPSSLKDVLDEFMSSGQIVHILVNNTGCLLYTSPSPRD